MRTLLLSPLIFAACAVAPAAQAQCVECAQQMFQATLDSQITYTRNVDEIDRQERSRQAQSRARPRSPSAPVASNAIPSSLMNQTQDAAFAALGPEHRRRAQAFGKANADRWMNGAARSVGHDVGALVPEYRRRVQSQGRTQADSWYIAQARDIGQRYVAKSR